MLKNLEIRDVCSVTSLKKLNRCRSFHFRYLELCRAKNLTPLSDIRTKNNATSMLDFYGDKFGVNDWLLIVEALYYDQVLQTLGIRMRKNLGMVLDHLDTEKKAKLFKQKPVIYTKFVFSGVVEAVSNCIEFNKNLRVLYLEGLPLNDKYVESIAKALSSNDSLREISFQRSNIYDKGCEAICNTIKYLENVEKLNLSECHLTTKGAEYVADMIKIQKISRYTEGWQKSLRYRDVDPDSIPGLRSITLARNQQIGDEGIKAIVEVLKEDVWVKVIDMEDCGLTDRAANLILDCLEINHYIIDFNVRHNPGISKFLQRSIRDQLGKDDDDQKMLEGQQGGGQDGMHGANGTSKKTKVTVSQLKEQLKTLEEQLAFERMLRKKAEQLNERLNQQIIAYENQLQEETNAAIPEGYVVVKNESLQSIIRERNDFHKIATTVCANERGASNISKNKQQNQVNKQLHQQLQQQQLQPQQQPLHLVPSSLVVHPMPSIAAAAAGVPKETRKALKVRKVKSETKYVDPLPKDSSKKKESKSDHEFANETDFHLTSVHFETNIGDSLANNAATATQATQLTSRVEKKNNCSGNNTNNNGNNIINNINSNVNNACTSSHSKFELEDLSISTSRSTNSDTASTDSDTLRNADFQPFKVFIRRSKQQQQQQQYGQGEGGGRNIKSPRSLFLGLCED